MSEIEVTVQATQSHPSGREAGEGVRVRGCLGPLKPSVATPGRIQISLLPLVQGTYVMSHRETKPREKRGALG